MDIVGVAPLELFSTDSLVQLTEGGCQFTDELVELRLLGVGVLGVVADGLARHIVDDVSITRHVLVDFGGEVAAAQRTLRFNLEPVLPALHVEVVLRVAAEHNDLVLRCKRDQADRAVGHLAVLLLVVLMRHVRQTLQVPLQTQLSGLLGGIHQSSLNVSELGQDVTSARVLTNHVSDLTQQHAAWLFDALS